MFSRRIITGDESDVHSRWRHVFTACQRAGYCKTVKRRTNRRERREAKVETRDWYRDY
jgi:hypothetical protein